MHVRDLIKQKSYEHVISMLRRHPITFIPKILFFLVLASIPLFITLFLQSSFPTILTDTIYFPLLVLAGSIYYLSILLFFYTEFILFYLDLTILTNDRMVEMQQIGLFSRSISELELFRIQDVTSEVHGIFSTIFHYGDVYIKTASENTEIVLYDVPSPEKIREDLIRLSHEDRKYHVGAMKLDEY